jgi:CBS domain-containing protein
LQRWVAERVAVNTTFLRQMAENALRNRPPLGLVRDFVVASGGEHPDTIDLKLNGTMPYVDGARLIALANRLAETSTLGRFRAAVKAGALREKEADAWCDAYAFIQLLRMRAHQLQANQGMALDNHVNPDNLNDLDRRILKETFRQARKLQTRLALDYQL